MATFASKAAGDADLIRHYRFKNASGGTVQNEVNPGVNDATYSGTSIVIGKAGPISEMGAIEMAGTDAKITIPQATDINSLADGTVLIIGDPKSLSNAAARWMHRGNFDDMYGTHNAGAIEFRKQGSSGGGRKFIHDTVWTYDTGWKGFVFDWNGAGGPNSPEPRFAYGDVGGGVTYQTSTVSEGLTETVTATNDITIWADQSTTNRVIYGDIAEILIFDVRKAEADLDEYVTLAGTEPGGLGQGLPFMTILAPPGGWHGR